MPRLYDIANHKIWWLFYALGLSVATIALAGVHWDIVSAPMALDYYEGQIPLITGVFAAGDNPYTYEYQPEYTSVYGIVYHLLMVPFTFIFGNNLPIHRTVNAALIIGNCLLIFGVCWKRTKHFALAATAALLCYSAMLFYSTPIAASNALGLFLMLCTLLVPWQWRFSHRSLIVSACIAVTAFYTKIYFVLGALCLGLYLGLQVSIARAAAYAISLAVLAVISIAITVHSSPYYFDVNYFVVTNLEDIAFSNETLFRQLREFVRLYAGVWLMLAIALGMGIWRNTEYEPIENKANSARRKWIDCSLTRPLLRIKLDYFWLCFAGAVLTVCISLGRNPGNWMSYLFQLMTPFFAIAAVCRIHRQRIWPAVLVPPLLFSLYNCWQFLPKHFNVDQKPWQELNQLIVENEAVLSSQALLMLMVDNNKEIFQDGQTFYFPYASGKPEWAKHTNPKHQIEQVWSDYISRLYTKVEQQEYDIVLLHNWDVLGIFRYAPPNAPDIPGKDYFRQFYKRSHYIKIDLGGMPGGGLKKIGVWKPIPGQGKER